MCGLQSMRTCTGTLILMAPVRGTTELYCIKIKTGLPSEIQATVQAKISFAWPLLYVNMDRDNQ